MKLQPFNLPPYTERTKPTITQREIVEALELVMIAAFSNEGSWNYQQACKAIRELKGKL